MRGGGGQYTQRREEEYVWKKKTGHKEKYLKGGAHNDAMLCEIMVRLLVKMRRMKKRLRGDASDIEARAAKSAPRLHTCRLKTRTP